MCCLRAGEQRLFGCILEIIKTLIDSRGRTSKMATGESVTQVIEVQERKLLGTEELANMSCADFSEFKVSRHF